MLWIVDGYNVIRNNPELRAAEKEGLESGRETLLALARLLLAARPRDRVLLVFDGPARPAGDGSPDAGAPPAGRVAVLFSAGRSADDLIREYVEASDYPRQVTVVSGDREITRVARRRKCRVEEAEAFVSRVRVREARRRSAAAERLSPEAKGKIEAELRWHWLKEEEGG